VTDDVAATLAAFAKSRTSAAAKLCSAATRQNKPTRIHFKTKHAGKFVKLGVITVASRIDESVKGPSISGSRVCSEK
jgi:hypothetical protein